MQRPRAEVCHEGFRNHCLERHIGEFGSLECSNLYGQRNRRDRLHRASGHRRLPGGLPGVPPASPNTAPTLANSPEPTGVYLLNNAATPSGTRGTTGDVTASQPRSFQLDGTNAEFDRHVGHQVEIAGTVHTESVGASPGQKTPVQHIQVKSLRMVAAKCPEQAVTPK